ncbi:kinesin-like protein KIN-12B [Pistacia vera]|uniref:kinesin-like protein KIN-12B n=1 Tax=Pistacia vera TaxID=55513 RepID=UPI001262F861|nr:kinesin-like protein KIN-12B [Pistacia vera]
MISAFMMQGLSNRRTGATSINAESSRSHSVFTCVVESRCKSKADGISRFKTSRINLVDLAGSERQKLAGAAGEHLKEAGNIIRSLSQLGYVSHAFCFFLFHDDENLRFAATWVFVIVHLIQHLYFISFTALGFS